MKKGFTLAEVLITLTIIGVIAAITIPNLMKNYQKHQYVVGLKKVYSILQNAAKMMPLTENCPAGDYDCVGVSEQDGDDVTTGHGTYIGYNYVKILRLLSNNMKTKEICADTNDGCMQKYKNGFAKNASQIKGGLILQDGTIIVITDERASSIPYPLIFVDINGLKKPNQYGRDIFAFFMALNAKNGVQAGTIIPRGSRQNVTYDNNMNSYWKQNNQCSSEIFSGNWLWGVSCTGRVLEENAMNY